MQGGVFLVGIQLVAELKLRRAGRVKLVPRYAFRYSKLGSGALGFSG